MFLPGAWEIRRTQELLESALRGGRFRHPASRDTGTSCAARGNRGASALRRSALGKPRIGTIQPGKQRRVWCWPRRLPKPAWLDRGVRIVLDAGVTRGCRNSIRYRTDAPCHPAHLTRFERATPVAPGAWRRACVTGCGPETTQHGLIPQSIPEIRQADLAPLALDLAAWGAKDVQSLSWLDPPPDPARNPGARIARRSRCLGCRGSYHCDRPRHGAAAAYIRDFRTCSRSLNN